MFVNIRVATVISSIVNLKVFGGPSSSIPLLIYSEYEHVSINCSTKKPGSNLG